MANGKVGNTLENQLLPSTNPTPLNKTGFIFASRRLNFTQNGTTYSNNRIILPETGEIYPAPYVPFYLGAYTNGASALAKLAKMGFHFTLGSSYTNVIPAPNNVSVSAITGVTTLTWTSPVSALNQIVGMNPRGSLSQATTTAQGTITNITVTGNISVITVVPVSGSAAFNTTPANVITINALLSGGQADPATSDQLAVFVDNYYNELATSSTNPTSPDLLVCPLIDGDATDVYAPETPVELNPPIAVDDLGGNSWNLTFAIDTDNLGLLPNVYYGNTTVTQDLATDAVGIFNGLTFETTTSGDQIVIINVLNHTGSPFQITTGAVTIVRDFSLNPITTFLQKTPLRAVGMCYNVKNGAELTANYPNFVSCITDLRQPAQISNNKANLQGYYSYQPPTYGVTPIAQITSSDTDAYVVTCNTAINTVFQYPSNATILTARRMFKNLNSDVPYYANSGEEVIIGVTPSNNKATIPDDIILGQLFNQGVCGIGVNAQGLCYLWNDICGLQTISGVTDTEYRYQATQNKLAWLDQNINRSNIINTTNSDGTRKNNTPNTLKAVQNGALSVLQSGVLLGMLGNTDNSATVGLNPDDVTRILLTVTTTLVPPNNGVDTIVVVRSYTL